MADRVMKQGDTWPLFEGRLWANTAQTIAVDLTEAEEVRLWLRSTDHAIATDPCIIVDAAEGRIAYHFSEEETQYPGDYKVEFEVRWEPGLDEKPRVQTFPNDGYLSFVLMPELDPTEGP